MSDRNALIDEAIMSEVGVRWLKVARIVGRVGEALEGRIDGISLNPSTKNEADKRDAFLVEIAKRIEALVAEGRLEGAGELSRWRHSEVRVPPHAQ